MRMAIDNSIAIFLSCILYKSFIYCNIAFDECLNSLINKFHLDFYLLLSILSIEYGWLIVISQQLIIKQKE